MKKKDEIIRTLRTELEESTSLKMLSERQLLLAVPTNENNLSENRNLQILLDEEIQEHLRSKFDLNKIQNKLSTIQLNNDEINKSKNNNILIQEKQELIQKQQQYELESLRENTVDQAEQIRVRKKMVKLVKSRKKKRNEII